MGETNTKDLKKRMKELLKEPENAKCSECRSKKHRPAFFSLLQTPERGQLGVFCCKNCHEFHLALGADYATVKNLKKPEEWTEKDVSTLESSGNAAVNKIYESGMQGNHTDKHMGALASVAFVESKYKQCLYFSSEVYEEQMALRAMIQFAKDQKPREQPPPPTMEEKLKGALRRQSQMPAMRGAGAGGENKEPVLLRGFGASPTKDEEGQKPRETMGEQPTMEKRPSDVKRRSMRRTKSLDGDTVTPLSSQRRSKKPDAMARSSKQGSHGFRRSNTAEFESSNHRNRDGEMKRSRRPRAPGRSSTYDERVIPEDSGRRPRARRGSSFDLSGDSGPAGRFRRTTTVSGAAPRGNSGPGLRRTNTEATPRSKSGPGLRRTNTGDRMAKRGGSSGRRKVSRTNSRGEEIPARTPRKSRERSVSPARSKDRGGRMERSVSPVRSRDRSGRNDRGVSPVRVNRKDRRSRSPNPRSRSPNFESSFSSKPDSSSGNNGLDSSSNLLDESTGLFSQGELTNGNDDFMANNHQAWTEQIEGVTWSRSDAKEMVEKVKRESLTESGTEAESDKNLESPAWTETFDDVAWSRNSPKSSPESSKNIFQKAFGSSDSSKRGSKASRTSWVGDLISRSGHIPKRVSKKEEAKETEGFTTSFTDLGFENFLETSEGGEDDEDGACLLSGGAMSSQ